MIKKLLVVLFCLWPSVCSSQQIEFSGSALWQGDFNDLHVLGSFGFCANQHGLLILEISDPASPVVVSDCYLPEASEGVFVLEDYAYLACGEGGLAIVDVSDPTRPTFTGSCDSVAEAQGVYVDGSYAFVADGYGGLKVVEIADPFLPVLAGSLDTPGITRNVYLSGDFAYLADFYGGVQIVEISNPTDPYLVTSYETIGNAYDVFLLGEYAYVAEGDSGLEIIDVSEPDDPSFVGRFQTAGFLASVFVHDSCAYLAVSTGGLLVLEVSDPSSPQQLGHYPTFPSSITEVFVQAGLAYLCQLCPHEILVIDVRDPENPWLKGLYSAPGRTMDVCYSDSILFCANGSSGLSVVEASDYRFPREIARLTLGDTTYALDLWKENLYLADGEGGLKVVGISDPEDPTLVGEAPTPASAVEVFVDNDLAFVVTRYQGLFIFDVSEPSLPIPVGEYHRPAEIWEVAVQDTFAYLTTGMGGLEIVNISDPSSPARVARLRTHSYTRSVLVDGGYAYVGDAVIYGVHIIDISDPTDPFEVGTYPRYEYIEGLYKSGRHLFFTTKFARKIVVLDVGEPSSPANVAEYMAPGVPRRLSGQEYSLLLASEFMCCILDFTPLLDLEVWAEGAPVVLPPEGGYVYYSLRVSNTSDSLVGTEIWRNIFLPDSSERFAGMKDLFFHPHQIRSRDSLCKFVPTMAPAGEYTLTVYVGTFPSAITDASSFTFVKLDTPRPAEDICLNAGEQGLKLGVLPEAYSLSQNSPNPFNLSTTIRYTLKEAGHVRLEVFNLRGEKAATLVDGHQKAGEGSVVWRPEGLSSGIYFYRLTSGDFTDKRRALLLK